jgi:hypothetical protein
MVMSRIRRARKDNAERTEVRGAEKKQERLNTKITETTEVGAQKTLRNF